MLEVHQFPCLSDNYGYLLHDPDSEETTCIDTPDADAYLREAKAKGWQITQIWNTPLASRSRRGQRGDQGRHRLHGHRPG